MKDFSKWQDSAAEEAIEESLKSSMDVCSQIRKDADEKNDVDHEKLESLQYIWKTLRNIFTSSSQNNEKKTNNVLDNIIKSDDATRRKFPTIDDYITSPVKI